MWPVNDIDFISLKIPVPNILAKLSFNVQNLKNKSIFESAEHCLIAAYSSFKKNLLAIDSTLFIILFFSISTPIFCVLIAQTKNESLCEILKLSLLFKR